MKEWLHDIDPKKLTAEGLKWLMVIAGTYAISTLALSRGQRESIREERDGGRCQGHKAGIKHKCGGRLEVHHILSGMYLSRLGIDADANPYVLITICSNLHNTIHNGKIEEAKQKYRQGNKNAFKEMAAEMREQISSKQLNWNPEWDRRLLARAAKLQQEWMKRGGGYPLNRDQQRTFGRDRI